MTSWLIYSSSHPQCQACSGCSVFVEWKSEQIKRSFISSKGRARHEYSVFTGASDKLEHLEKWIWAKGKFSKHWGHSNPNRVSWVGGWQKKKKPGDFACAVLLSRIPLQVKGSREVNKYSEERSQRACPPHTPEMGPVLSSAEGQRARRTHGLQNTL